MKHRRQLQRMLIDLLGTLLLAFLIALTGALLWIEIEAVIGGAFVAALGFILSQPSE